MNMLAIAAAATAQLRNLLYQECERLPLSQPSDGGGGRTQSWPEPGDGEKFPCCYEESQAPGKGRLGYDSEAGYDYDIWMLPDQEMLARDRIVTPAGMVVSVVAVAPIGAPGPLRKAKTDKI